MSTRMERIVEEARRRPMGPVVVDAETEAVIDEMAWLDNPEGLKRCRVTIDEVNRDDAGKLVSVRGWIDAPTVQTLSSSSDWRDKIR